MILSVYKPLGLTPLQAIQCLRESRPELAEVPITYAGRLDPIAEGLLLLLTGNDRFEREQFLQLPKTYEVEILFRFGTDSYDILGLVTEMDFSSTMMPDQQVVQNTLASLQGSQLLPLPPYASVPVQGKPLFEWARAGKLNKITIPVRVMDIQNIELLEHRKVSGQILQDTIIHRVNSVTGDFRQAAIIEQWKKYLENYRQTTFSIYKIRIECGSGTYIRSIVQALGKRLGIPAVLYHLTRTAVGSYTIPDAITLT